MSGALLRRTAGRPEDRPTPRPAPWIGCAASTGPRRSQGPWRYSHGTTRRIPDARDAPGTTGAVRRPEPGGLVGVRRPIRRKISAGACVGGSRMPTRRTDSDRAPEAGAADEGLHLRPGTQLPGVVEDGDPPCLAGFRRGTTDGPAGTGGEEAGKLLDSIAARDDLSRELEGLFDLELLEAAMRRVRLRAAPHTWMAFSMTALEGIPARGRPPAGHEDRPRLRGPQHHPAAIAGGVSEIGVGGGGPMTIGADPHEDGPVEWDDVHARLPLARDPGTVPRRHAQGPRGGRPLRARRGMPFVPGELERLVEGTAPATLPRGGGAGRGPAFRHELEADHLRPGLAPPPGSCRVPRSAVSAPSRNDPAHAGGVRSRAMRSSASWAGAPWASCTRPGSSASGG